jgi:serine protease inhibitor
LYFKGYWKTPFQRAKEEDTFFKNGTEKISTKMMYTTGEFDVGQIPELDSAIISLPYKVSTVKQLV